MRDRESSENSSSGEQDPEIPAKKTKIQELNEDLNKNLRLPLRKTHTENS